MKPKKNPKVDLEKRKTLFFEIGLAMALLVIFISFQLRFKIKDVVEVVGLEELIYEEEMMPVTRQQDVPPPLKQPPKITVMDVISIVEDEEDIEKELELEDVEVSEDDSFDYTPMQEVADEEEVLDEMEIFVVVEEMPIFRPDICKTRAEGDIELYKFIYSNIKYPPVAQENGISGRVYVRFVVSKDGSVTNVEVVRGVDASLDKEAVRVIKSLPKFSPGKQRGLPVQVAYSAVIKFVLQ